MKQKNLSPQTALITVINTFFFIIGLYAHFMKFYLLTAFCLLVLSLIVIYQLITAKEEEHIETVNLEEDDSKWEYLKKIKDLTEDNQQQSTQIIELQKELEALKRKNANFVSDIYDFPLSSTTSIDINAIVSEYVEQFKKRFQEKHISCAFTTSYDGSAMFLSLSAMHTILKNLFDNILKFTPEGGSANIHLVNHDDSALFIIKNSSPAISPKELEKIFSLNYQATNKHTGTGLGLSQVYAIVRDYGGSIYAKSNQDTGFTIYLELPYHMIKEQDHTDSPKEVAEHEE